MKITTTIPFKKGWEIIKSDFKTPAKEIKQKSYNWHWIGGIIVKIILVYLFFTKADFTIEQALVMSFVVNSGIWIVKEFAWWTALTFVKKFPLLQKLQKYKLFQWSEIDYKDWRFSTYGGAPIITGLIYLFTKKNEL